MRFFLTIFLMGFFLIVSACSFFETAPAEPGKNEAGSASPNTGGETNSENAPNEAAPEALSKDAKASIEQIVAKDAAETGLGPTDTMRAFNDAVVKKDVARIKSFLSRASLKMIEQSAREQKTTVDKILTAEDGAPMPAEREMQNETIDGDNATLEVKNSVLGNYDKMFLVKENGNWRVALDKFRDEMLRKINQGQRSAPSNR